MNGLPVEIAGLNQCLTYGIATALPTNGMQRTINMQGRPYRKGRTA